MARKQSKPIQPKTGLEDEPVFHFVALDKAMWADNGLAVQGCCQELERLGYRVTITMNHPRARQRQGEPGIARPVKGADMLGTSEAAAILDGVLDLASKVSHWQQAASAYNVSDAVAGSSTDALAESAGLHYVTVRKAFHELVRKLVMGSGPAGQAGLADMLNTVDAGLAASLVIDEEKVEARQVELDAAKQPIADPKLQEHWEEFINTKPITEAEAAIVPGLTLSGGVMLAETLADGGSRD